MDKQAITAYELERSILNRVRGIFAILPDHITAENKCIFVRACDRVEDITTEAFAEAESLGCRDYFSGWRRILTPWWRNGYGNWEYAWGYGFTWEQFIDYIVESGSPNVRVYTEVGIPTISFIDDEGFTRFHIALSTED